jgi:hypothetical protein
MRDFAECSLSASDDPSLVQRDLRHASVVRRPTPSLDRMREQVRERVALTNLRHVARAAGISSTGLKRFLDGGPSVLPTTRRNLFRYLVTSEAAADERAAHHAALINELVRDLPAVNQSEAVVMIVRSLRAGFESPGRVPLWMNRVAAAAEKLVCQTEEVQGEDEPMSTLMDCPL